MTIPGPGASLRGSRGDAADQAYPNTGEAKRWAEFLISLHKPAPADAPINEVRGVPLAQRETAVTPRIDRLKRLDLLPAQVLAIWEQALAAPVATGMLWLHGDLHAQNVVTRNHQLAAVIDWGDITSGDPATDLSSSWAIFDDPVARHLILEIYNADQACVERARGWAVMFGVILLDSGMINSPRHAAMGQIMLRSLIAER
jgi:aminoglycoside phosphotransferase (APT) family kinase protein